MDVLISAKLTSRGIEIYTSTIKSPSAVQMSKSIKQTQSVDKVYYKHPYTYKYTHIYVHIHACMHIHTSIYTYIFHSMWTTQTSTRYVWEAKPNVPDE